MLNLKYKNKLNIRQFVYIFGSGILIAIYIHIYVTEKGVLHPEAIIDISHFIQGGMHGFKDFIAKSFDLNMIEWSCYRPRLLAFMIQYLDIKLWMSLNSYGIHIGGRFLLALLSVPLLLFGVNLILRNLFSDMTLWERLFIASGLLFVEQYIVASLLFLRSAKVLSSAVCIFLIGWTIDSYVANRKYSIIEIVAISFIFSMVVTIDEQVIAFLFILTIGCFGERVYLFVRNEHNVNKSTLFILIGSCLSYAIYYLWWGRLLFAYFTGTELLEHPHTFYKAIEFFDSYIIQGMVTFAGAVTGMCGDPIVFVIFIAVYALTLALNQNRINILRSLYIMGSMMALSIGMVAAHPPIAAYPNLKHGMYYINCMFGVIFSFWLAVSGISIRRLESFNKIKAEYVKKGIVIVSTLIIVTM